MSPPPEPAPRPLTGRRVLAQSMAIPDSLYAFRRFFRTQSFALTGRLSDTCPSPTLSFRTARRVELVRADRTVRSASTRPDVATLVEILELRLADLLVAGIDRGAASLNPDGLGRPAIVSEARWVKLRVGVAQRSSGSETTSCAIVEVVPAIRQGAEAIPARGAVRDNRIRDGCSTWLRSAG